MRVERAATTQLRIKGYLEAGEQSKHKVLAAVVQRNPDEAVFKQQVADIMASRRAPTAIVASNSMVALSLVQVLQQLKVRWPDDVTLLAFDEPVWAPILSPPLSVVRHPTQRIALDAK